MRVIRSGSPSQPGPEAWFTGVVWIDHVAVGDPPSRLSAIRVHFSPGARTAWHSHPLGQVLHVLHGIGRVQQRGCPIEEIQSGDTVVSAPGEWHWHGAGPHNVMTHLAMHEARDDGSTADWGEPVADEDYRLPPP